MAIAALAAIVFFAPAGNRTLAYLVLLLCAATVLFIRQQLIATQQTATALHSSRREELR